MRRTLTWTALGLPLVLLLTVLGSAPAGAQPTGGAVALVCDPGGKKPYYSFSKKKPIYIRARHGRIIGDSGVTLTIQKGTSQTIGGSVTGTVSAEAGVIFAKASASLAIQVQYSRTSTLTFSGSWTVPKSQKSGWFEVGTNNGYKFKWQRYHYKSPCTKVVEKSGTAKGPTKTATLRFRHS